MNATDAQLAPETLIPAVLAAGAATLRHRADGLEPRAKADASPVTAADHEAEAILLAALARHAPGVPVVAEEEAAAGRTPDVGVRFFLVDPLDGTREFVRGGDDFTVNVALIENGAPRWGIVFAPARGDLYWGDVAARRARHARVTANVISASRSIGCSPCDGAPRAVASHSHNTPETDRYLEHVGAGARVAVGSSLKFALLAAGEADLYPRAGPTMEWDTAAGDHIVTAAGGTVLDQNGEPLTYGHAERGYLNGAFVALGDRSLTGRVRLLE